MLLKALVICYLVLFTGIEGASDDKEDRSEEILEEQQIDKAPGNGSSSSIETRFADSHEAMNNRDTTEHSRKKRNYEFLIGLVHNNSKYEVTRTDPSSTPISSDLESSLGNGSASEMLLELMVKIASDPEQWARVHKLLQKIDSDLLKSREIVSDIQNNRHPKPQKKQMQTYQQTTKKESSPYGSILHETDDAFQSNKAADEAPQSNTSKVIYKSNDWSMYNNENYAPYLDARQRDTIAYARPRENADYRGFEYRVVTDRPLHHHSNGQKAYIAVSLIAPKPIEADEDDMVLENELRQLKPWPHRPDMPYHQMRWMKKNKKHL